MSLEKQFQELVDKWPSTLVARTEAGRFSGGILNEKTLANYDSLGTGPAERFRIGRKICYPTNALAQWMQGRAARV